MHSLSLKLGFMGKATAAGGGSSPPPGSPLVNYDFSDDANMSLSGTSITGATDLGSAGADLSQATGDNQPLNTGTINGVQAADFDGTADYLQVTDATALAHFADTNPVFTMAVVAELDTTTGNQVIAALNTSTSADGYYSVTKLDFSYFFQGFNGAGASLTASGGHDTNPHNLLIVKSATTVDVYIDGVLGTNDGTMNIGSLSIDRITVGAWQQNGSVFNRFNGRIGQVVIYDSVLTGTDLTDLQSYIDTKWGFS